MEQRLYSTVGTGARQSSTKTLDESDPLFVEVQAKRAYAEGLLLAAMKLLHEQRHPPGGPERSGT
ncbi:MAG: hypothetical protein K0Q43_5747 [Ramlibacter sp.]|jgi:hypothetical protein|nr:hypothetical protein [Ramlibacter sp.]